MDKRGEIEQYAACGGTGLVVYVGLLSVLSDGPRAGDIHIGALILGIAGSIALGIVTWRGAARFVETDG